MTTDAQTAKKPTTRALTSDIAIEQFADLLTQFHDPDTVLETAGLSRTDLRKQEGDGEIAAALETRLNACLATPWRLEPGNGQVTDFVWEQLEGRIEGLITGAWQAIPYGYAVQEVIYRRTDDGRILWDRIEERPFEWFRPTPDGRLLYFPRSGAGGIDGRPVDTVFKFFLTRRRASYRLPMGQALLSRLYLPWFFRTNGWKFWARFLERFGAPLLVGKTVGSTDEMAATLAQAVQSAVAAIGAEDAVDAIAPQGNGESFRLFSDAVDRSVQKVILGQTLTTDVGSKGSFAAAKVHNEVRDDRRMSDLRIVSGTIQRMIDALVALNFPAAESPQFIMEDGRGLEKDRAERDARLVQAGILRLTEDYLLRVYDFEPEDFVVPEPGGGAEGGQSAQHGRMSAGLKLAARTTDDGRFTPAQAALESLADEALAQAGSPIPVDKILEAIRASRTPDALYDRLARLYDGDDAEAFQDLLERALFAADVLGFSAETEGKH